MSNTESFSSIHLKGGNDCNSGLPDLLVKGGAKIKKNVRIGGIITAQTLDIRSDGEIDGDLHVKGLITSDAARELVPNNAAENRRLKAYQKRVSAAYKQYSAGVVAHPTNGDEDLYPSRIGNFHKGLPHNALGEVDATAYESLLHAVQTGNPEDYDAIIMGDAHAKLTCPQAGPAYGFVGIDTAAIVEPAPPTIASAQRAGEAVELYWMSLLRDVNFSDYATHPLAAAACAEINGLTFFNGPTDSGNVTPETLFRGPMPGNVGGPYISQFMYLACPFGVTEIDQKIHTIDPEGTQIASGLTTPDFGTVYSEWLNIQNGKAPTHALVIDSSKRYVRNGRDLAQNVHKDVLCQAMYQAMLILYTFCPYNVGNPYKNSANQEGFSTFGGPHIAGLLPEGCYLSIIAQWFQKWNVHRCLRPEAFGGLVHNTYTEAANYPLHADILTSNAVSEVHALTGTYLLPQVFAEYSPYHPSYGSGHATVVGFGATILKAFFDGSTVIPNPVQPNSAGTALEPYVGPALTVAGELNKLAYNVACGRCHAGIHWRSDSDESLKLGEKVAIEILRDQRLMYNERFNGFTFTKFDGTTITI